MEFPIIEFEQNRNKLISTVLPFQFVKENSHVLVYGIDEGGYQREPNEAHLNQIKKYLLEDPNPIFPTSIVLGLDEDIAKGIITNNSGASIMELKVPGDKKLFRIIDGQHRIGGLERAAKENRALYDFKLNVIILKTDANHRSQEMEIFHTINSKGKRLKVDLIELARFNYRILEGKIDLNELNKHIAVQVAFNLNEGINEKDVWQNAIKFGIHDDEKVGIVGVNAFAESLKLIVNLFMQKRQLDEKGDKKALIRDAESLAADITKFLSTAWSIIEEKWYPCFGGVSRQLDFYDDLVSYRYNKGFYIQKTLGVKSLHKVLYESINESGYNPDDPAAMDRFREIIMNSKVLVKDWKMGNTFSGYSSESAFNRVKDMIMGNEPIPRNFENY